MGKDRLPRLKTADKAELIIEAGFADFLGGAAMLARTAIIDEVPPAGGSFVIVRRFGRRWVVARRGDEVIVIAPAS